MPVHGRALLGVIASLLLVGGAAAGEPDAAPGCPHGYGVDDSGNVYVCGHAQRQAATAAATDEHRTRKIRAVRQHPPPGSTGARARRRDHHPVHPVEPSWPFEAMRD